MPDAVATKFSELELAPLDLRRWNGLSSLQRFTLVKLTRGGHENENFLPTLREFDLAA